MDPRDPIFPEPLQHVEMDSSKYVYGGLEVKPMHLLRLVSEIESAYQLSKYMAFDEDMHTLEEMKSKYLKMYFKMLKEEKANSN